MAQLAKRLALVGLVSFLTLTAAAEASHRAGSLDSSFSDDGRASVAMGFRLATLAVGVQPDGGVVLITSAWGKRPGWPKTVPVKVVRLAPSGRVDRSFGNDGQIVFRVPFGSEPFDVRVLPDGRGVVPSRADVRRFTADGKPDVTFGDGGIAPWPVPARRAAVQQDGSIVFASSSLVSPPLDWDLVLGRLRPDGSLDTAFADRGLRRLPRPLDMETPRRIAVREDGTIVLIAESYPHDADEDAPGEPPLTPLVVHLLPNGEDDPMVPGLRPAFPSIGSPIALDDGSLVRPGLVRTSRRKPRFDTSVSIARYTAAAQPDWSWGIRGRMSIDLGPRADVAFTATADARSRLVVAGSSEAHGGRNVGAILRLTPTGRLDRSFARRGWTKTAFKRTASFEALAIGPGGRIVAASRPAAGTQTVRVARYLGGPTARP
jgi:uncharacterized delta-60 repeat protein